MNIFIPLGLLLFLITFAARNSIKRSQKAFLFSFLAMFVFAALRYNYGPDYDSYENNFTMLKSLGVEGFLDYNQHSETGFVYFFNLFNSYFVFIIVQSFIWLGISYLFFRNNVPEQYYFIVILMLFFNINFSLLNFTAIRSSLAGCFFFAALMILNCTWDSDSILPKVLLNFLKKWKLIIYLLLVYAGAQFHTSVIIFLIFPFITNSKNISKSFSKVLIFIGFFLAVFSVMFRTTFTLALTLWIIDLFPSSFDRYTDYLDMLNTAGGGLGALLFNVMKILIAYPIIHALRVEEDSKYIRLMQFAIFFLYTFLLINENLLTRFTMCFYPVIIVALLRSCKYINYEQRFIGIFSIVFLSLFQFYMVINTSSYRSFWEYHTIFSAPNWM